MPIRALIIHPGDDVAVVVQDASAGDTIHAESSDGMQEVTALVDIPAGHKVAVREVSAGSDVVKYGEKIGLARVDIQPGEHVHMHNLASDRVKIEE